MAKVKLDVLKPWITKRIAEILGLEDDVVVEFVFNQLEDDRHPDPRKMQINLTGKEKRTLISSRSFSPSTSSSGFLNGKNARLFMGELWTMLDAAQNNESGIPQELLDQKKEEMRNRKVWNFTNARKSSFVIPRFRPSLATCRTASAAWRTPKAAAPAASASGATCTPRASCRRARPAAEAEARPGRGPRAETGRGCPQGEAGAGPGKGEREK